MKKTIALLLAAMLLLVGCGANPPASPTTADEPQAPSKPTTLTITFSNTSGYIFNEIYISPTASNSHGEELLGSTRILKSNGSLDINIPAYDFDTYDILVVDEAGDRYNFSRVSLSHGGGVSIYFGNDGLAADVTDNKGNAIGTVPGTLESATGGSDAPETYGTGYATNGEVTFTIYNESAFDIFAIHMGPVGGAAADDVDILPLILEGGENTTLTVTIPQGQWNETAWTLYVTDVDGDTSSSFDEFNPWTLSYVDITWENGGYVCSFN